MQNASAAAQADLSSSVSSEEWRTRVELAALYRLTALHGWDDMICTHISARIMGATDQFLINPYGLFFNEITASSLVRVDLQGKIAQQTPYYVNPFGFNIHSAVYSARPEVRFAAHLHSDQSVAVSAQKEGLLPLSQHALAVLPMLGYHDYKREAVDLEDCKRLTDELVNRDPGMEERERLAQDLGQKNLLLMRNHGTLALGKTAADCWTGAYYLERACKQQVMALSCGRENIQLVPRLWEEDGAKTFLGGGFGFLAWPGFLRRLDRECPGYDS